MRFKGLKSSLYAKYWDAAFPVGNGTIGCLVYGNPLHEKIVTNHEELYIPMPANNDLRPFKGAPYVEGMRKLLFEGKYYEATEYYLRGLEKDGHNYGEIIWTNPFETATEIYIDYEKNTDEKEKPLNPWGGDENVCTIANPGSDISNYSRRLDFSNGECVVSFNRDDALITRKAFVSRTRNVAAIEITSSKPLDILISTGNNGEIHDVEDIRHYVEGTDMIVSESAHSEAESGYVSCLKVISEGAEKSENGKGGINVLGTKKVLLLYTLSPWKKNLEATKVKVLRLVADTPADYDELLKEHSVIHRELFERVKITLSEAETEYTNEELREMCTQDKLAPELLERMADFGRYLEVASFGKMPPNLQGVWNGNANPPWCSDYTLDENIQMMMWQVLPGSLPEFARVYFDWLESFNEDFKKNARAYYDCDGIFCAPRVSTDGILRHFEHRWPMVFWTAGAGWLSQVYEDYYEYTGDKNILLRGVKYWKEVVKFYEDFLVEDENGRYVFAPSYSPENTPLGNDSPTAINATMDVAIAKEVYKNLINACRILGVENEQLPVWEKEYAKFPEYGINEDGALKEWIPESLRDDYHHRHSSHLYPIFPGHEALENGNEELLTACHRAAELRLLDGVDAISGWGLAHLANISARLKDSTLWYLALNRLIQKFTLDNMFTGHNEHFLFQMDANLGITAAVLEAFDYSDMEKMELFPVLSDALPYMKAEGLRGKGCMHIICLEKNGNEINAHLENQGKSVIRIVCPEGYSFEDGNREVELNPGAEVLLKAINRNM
ncbi:MAG: glycoside hydrolase family 95 protein [Lachnospiraceae bacterium]|nr:glycoside hydrolase family 95 protein [Lachnospiraceae bacterium]